MAVPYLAYFKLKEEPFNTTANPRFFFLSPIHSIALGKTEFTVDAKKGMAIVFGDTGYGKSTLARLLHVSQEQLRTKLAHPLARNFRSRIVMASTLEAMGQNEHAEMIDFRWRVASGNQQHPFTPDAIQAIYVHSKGMPREACIIADNSLLAAYLAGKTVVDKETVDAAFKNQ
jgi:type II secretory pathway predicted ATPase ExeA